MKIRSGFVSNSSSSSFIISGNVSPDNLKITIDLSKFGTIINDISNLNMKEIFKNPSNPVDWIEKIAKEQLQNNKTIFLGSINTTIDAILDIIRDKLIMNCDSDGETTDFIIYGDKITENDLKIQVNLIDFGKILPGNVVFTGKLSTSREEAKEQAESLGFIVKNTMSKNIDILVYGEGSGSKFQKAISLDIKILPEYIWNEILTSLEENNNIFYGDVENNLIGVFEHLDKSLEINVFEE